MESEYEIKSSKFRKLNDAHRREENMRKLKAGELRGAERAEAERDAAVQLNKEADIQGDIVKDIGKDIRGANANMQEMGGAIKQQGEQVDRIDDKLHRGQAQVKETDLMAQQMIRKEKCIKVVLWLANILVGIGIIIIIIIKGTNHYRCSHESKDE